jgi:hypothetical protein
MRSKESTGIQQYFKTETIVTSLVMSFKQRSGSIGARCAGNRLGKRESMRYSRSPTPTGQRPTPLLSFGSTIKVFRDQLDSIVAQFASACKTQEAFYPRQRFWTEEAS